MKKLSKYLNEAKLNSGFVDFEAVGGGFGKIANELIPSEGDIYIASPGVTSGDTYPVYKIKLDDSEVMDMNKKLKEVYKKAGDALDKVISSEFKKMGFKRTK
jgi:hypothetical protein